MGCEAQPEVREGSVGSPGAPVGVWKPTQMSGTGRKAHLKICDGSGAPPRGLGGVGRGQESNPEIQEGSGGPPKGQKRVRRPTRKSGRSRQALRED